MGARAMPGWPRMMRRTLAAAYVDMPVSDFERAMSQGKLPHPVTIVGQELWSRNQLDEALDRLTGEAIPDYKKGSNFYASR